MPSGPVVLGQWQVCRLPFHSTHAWKWRDCILHLSCTSMPSVSKFSGWPGVLEPHWRNCLMSSIDTLLYPAKCRREYWSMQPWPEESTKRSRFTHLGSSGLYCISSAMRRYPIGAWPMGAPGWPLLALFTASTAKKRMALMHSVSTSTSVAVARRTTCFFAHRLDGRTAALAAKAAALAPTTLAAAEIPLAGADAATDAGALVTEFSFLVCETAKGQSEITQYSESCVVVSTLQRFNEFCLSVKFSFSCSADKDQGAVGAEGPTNPGANITAAAPAAAAAVARWERVVGMAAKISVQTRRNNPAKCCNRTSQLKQSQNMFWKKWNTSNCFLLNASLKSITRTKFAFFRR